ncbi:MAG: DNA-processing protein DprA, partial [Paracoccaceae bacterium]
MTEDDISSTHPPLPPTTEDDRVAWLRLLRSRRVGVTTFYRLLAEHGTAQAALEALPKIAQDAGVQGYEVCPPAVVAKELAAGRKAGARLICYAEADYPTYLTQIPDAPPILWMRGVCDVLHRPMVALVGARNASSLGLRMARRMAEGLSEAGVVVVSGLARGIDTAAHTVAVSRGTVAVLGGGVDVAYPRENADLLAQIAETDAVLSEQPMGVTPQARHFPARNRIIAGMSL